MRRRFLVALATVLFTAACIGKESSTTSHPTELGASPSTAALPITVPMGPFLGATAVGSVQTLVPNTTQLFTLPLTPAGTTSFTYIGVASRIPSALASISGKYDAVYFTQPKEHGTQVFSWYPNQDSNALLETGAKVTIETKMTDATLVYPVVQPNP